MVTGDATYVDAMSNPNQSPQQQFSPAGRGKNNINGGNNGSGSPHNKKSAHVRSPQVGFVAGLPVKITDGGAGSSKANTGSSGKVSTNTDIGRVLASAKQEQRELSGLNGIRPSD